MKLPYIKQQLMFVLPCSLHYPKMSLQLICHHPALRAEHFIS